ncbi:MAG: cytochrome C554, partial [Bacteroidetes bacterium]|nr:cytochrome C554 [Bacteroidota bacterium]
AGLDAKFHGDKYKKEDGVGCESCHGAGGDYWTKEVMQAVTDGTTDGASVGLIKPDEKVCKTCHNEESPTAKEFNFAEMYPKIAHERPKDGK